VSIEAKTAVAIELDARFAVNVVADDANRVS